MTETLKSERHYVLGGKVILHQNAEGGHRAGLDAVMLAASISPKTDKPCHVVDLGAGVGTAGLCVAARQKHSTVSLVENDPETLHFTQMTLDDPDNRSFSHRVSLLDADVTLKGEAREAAGLIQNMADYVIMNPPFWEEASVRTSPNETKASAHVLNDEGLEPWLRTAAAILKAGGSLSVIFPSEGLVKVLNHMEGRFGEIKIFPLFRGLGEEAKRVIVTGVKGSRAPMRVLPGLFLHECETNDANRRPWTAQANAVLNGDASLFI